MPAVVVDLDAYDTIELPLFNIDPAADVNLEQWLAHELPITLSRAMDIDDIWSDWNWAHVDNLLLENPRHTPRLSVERGNLT